MPTVTVIQPTLIENTTKIRAAAYCRVSSSSEDQLNSYMAQVTYYSHKFEGSETETLIDVYADEGVTGTREDKREEFQRLMQDCRRGKIDRIYTKSISRFARNTKDCLKNVRELKSLGITIFFEKENIDTANMTDEMMITIMGGLAQEEAVSISQNVRWSIEKKMREGTYIISTPPFGYRMIQQKLVICNEEAEIVRYIFDSYLEGIGIRKIAEYLNTTETARPDKAKWSYITVRYILMNEKYAGNSLWHKFCTTDTLPYRAVINRGQKEKYYFPDSHPAIIPQEMFDRVQQLLCERTLGVERGEHIFQKRIYCGECGTLFRIKHIKDKTYWLCRKHDMNADSCSISQIPETKLQNCFIALCNKLQVNYKEILVPVLESLQELKLKKHSGNLQIMDIRKEIVKLREQQHILTRLKTKGFLDEAKFQTQTAELNTKISRLQRDLKGLTQSDDEDEILDQIEMLTDFFAKRQELMVYFEPEAFESIVEKIVVISRNELEFHLICGLKLTEYME